MRLELWASVDDAQIAAATYARGLHDVRTSPVERAVWRSVDAAAADGRFDRDVERALVAYVPDSVWAWMERFADGGSFPRVRFRFSLEFRPRRAQPRGAHRRRPESRGGGMSLADWLLLTVVGSLVVITFWWAFWLIHAKPTNPLAATGILLIWLLGVGAPVGGFTLLAWHLTQRHSEHVCLWLGGIPGHHRDSSDTGVYADGYYDNPNNLEWYAGEHWCGVVEYQVGATYPWLVSGGPAR